MLTRNCLDPWNYLEFRPDGRVAPCCIQDSVDWGEQLAITLPPLPSAGHDVVQIMRDGCYTHRSLAASLN